MKNLFFILLIVCYANLNLESAAQEKVNTSTFTNSSTTEKVDFNTFFSDQTLRLDYIFSGDVHKQDISLSEMVLWDQWVGRRHNLNKLPLLGNGDIRVRDLKTQKTIYRTSFSSLFQEWILTPEAKQRSRAFENCFQIPMPLHDAEVEIILRNAHQDTIADFIHPISPKDILIRKVDAASSQKKTAHEYIQISNKSKAETTVDASQMPWHDPKQAIDVAIVAEGYTADEMDTFKEDAKMAIRSITSYAPFSKYSNRFNFLVVCSPSIDSGVTIPRNEEWKETAVSSHFDTFYSRRYLTTQRLKKLHNLLAGFPYEHIIVLANTDTYGGGGIYNSYTLTTAHHALFWPVVTHEFGHSFGGLADEYAYANAGDDSYYPSDREPWEPNITTLHNFKAKWKDMLSKGCSIPTPTPNATSADIHSTTKLGVYEGAGYQEKGTYRSTPDCRMRTNDAKAFCPVCQRALTRIINFYTK